MSIVASQKAVIDGAEYQTLQASLGRPATEDAATWTIVVGDTEDKKRVVGVLCPKSEGNGSIYSHTMAELGNATPGQAICTMLHAVSHVHACLPQTDASLFKKNNWHVVIVGGGELAQGARKALSSCFGYQTTIVTTRKDIPNSMEPAVGELEIGFGQVIGNFDVLLDTIGDEFCDQETSVVTLLKQQHGCGRYLSTGTQAQEIVADKGVLFGPNAVNQYMFKVQERNDLPQFKPPSGLGTTVETLIKQGIFFNYPEGNPGKVYIRGWTLKQYWEAMTWPRDSAGGANIRFGFPIPEDLDGIEERFMINEPPSRQAATLVDIDVEANEAKEDEASPFLVKVVGIKGLQSEIIEPRRNCLLFLSAPFCRTCRYLSPQYLRLASQGQKSGLMFAKADATGSIGKQLGKVLEVDSVPTFILFREGRVFGKALSISRLPSNKLLVALELLNQGLPWDENKVRDADEKVEKD